MERITCLLNQEQQKRLWQSGNDAGGKGLMLTGARQCQTHLDLRSTADNLLPQRRFNWLECLSMQTAACCWAAWVRTLRWNVFRLGLDTYNMVIGTLCLCVQHNAIITALVSIHTAGLVLFGFRLGFEASVSNLTMDVSSILYEFYKNKTFWIIYRPLCLDFYLKPFLPQRLCPVKTGLCDDHSVVYLASVKPGPLLINIFWLWQRHCWFLKLQLCVTNPPGGMLLWAFFHWTKQRPENVIQTFEGWTTWQRLARPRICTWRQGDSITISVKNTTHSGISIISTCVEQKHWELWWTCINTTTHTNTHTHTCL